MRRLCRVLGLVFVLGLSAQPSFALDCFVNFGLVTLASGIDASASSATLVTGDGLKLPAGCTFEAVLSDSNLGPAHKDPLKEIVTAGPVSGDSVPIVRAQQGTSASAHNTNGHTYVLDATLTKKWADEVKTRFSNGFATLAGATASRNYTFPDASATILSTNAAVTVPQGGTGAQTLTGILQGNGTGAVTAIAVPADSSKFLDGTGAFSSPTASLNSSASVTLDTTSGNTFRVQMATPGTVTATPGAAGTLNNGTYGFRVVAVDYAGGTSLPSAEATCTTVAGVGAGSCGLSWTAVTGATSYRIYGSAVGAEDRYQVITYALNNVVPAYAWTTASGATVAALPVANTAYASSLAGIPSWTDWVSIRDKGMFLNNPNGPGLLIRPSVQSNSRIPFMVQNAITNDVMIYMDTGGGINTVGYICADGNQHITIDAAGVTTISHTGCPSEGLPPGMITGVSDVVGPTFTSKTQNAGAYHFQALDHSASHLFTFSIGDDGTLSWGAGANHAAEDTTLYRSAATVLATDGSFIANRAGIATTTTDGFVLQNLTAATSGVPVQQSPALRLRSNVWNTTATAATNTDDWIIQSVPVSGATPSGLLKFGKSLNGGGTTFPFTLSSAGIGVFAGDLTSQAGNFTTGAGAFWIFTGRSVSSSPANGQLNLTNNAPTAGIGLDFATDGLLKIRTRAQSADAAISALTFQTMTALVALGGGAAPTFGTIGGSGPATAAQNTWLLMKDSTGASFWVPAWK